MATGSSSPSGTRSPGGPAGGTGISTYKGEEQALRAGRLGTAGLLLSVLAATGPLMVVAGVMPTTYGVMGIVGQPLLFLILGVVLALFSLGYAEMSRHVHNAGAFYAYISRGLGGTAGAGAALVALVAYSALQAGLYGLLGFEVSGLLQTYFDVEVAWWIPALATVALVGVLAWMKIDLNARVLGVLLLIEVALVVIFDIAAVVDPAKEGLSLHAFNPDTLTGAGVATSLCFCIAAFTGFEQAPVYAEETSRPQVVVARVMFFAVGFVAVFFALSSWALTVAAGPSGIVPAAREQSAGLLFGLTESRLGGTFTDVLHVLFVTGMFAAILSFHNVVARYAFAMGREGLLPAAFGRTNTSTGAPGTGSLLQTVVSVVVVIGFAVADDGKAGDPTAPVLHLFTWGGNIGALGVILLMATASVAVIVFFARRGAARAQAWRIAASALAAVGLLVIAGYTVKDFDVLVGAGPDSTLSWALPGIIFLAAVVGVAYGAILRARNPEAHARIGLGNEAFQLEKASSSPGA
ncbi:MULTISPECIES: APC family permease [unclassified Streptomyces]|uniref:APC family permease n=1 Tax=unclassified Streptomyces TaxID=2593676 RepID=UPI00136BD8F7|nr:MULTISPECIES: APC family permease [unclassified Streptomyces]NDZ98948.1 APC family permease [Streptomyces sp. SID10116]MYY86054.1 amino acid permease [Streptomyces sp. SID335]MYZ19201.1 amino acid permease [Streptomyces sp. SID337]NDZ85703.1 APC family permease [Streptomyces sp. SID10115]NEB44488.1 APC family permease [Streptomyces sp. SID339]